MKLDCESFFLGVLKYSKMLVLASNSPRRKQLLTIGNWQFSVMASHIDESMQPGELPGEYVRRLAEGKAEAVLSLLGASENMEKLIIAADTAVVAPVGKAADGKGERFEILGKPIDRRDAESMLRRLRARQHLVYTALAVFRVIDEKMRSEVIISKVPMRNYRDDEMMAYIDSGDPLDKAGAYAIQHSGFSPVVDFQGCYANVMGLPVCHLTRILAEFGILTQAPVPQACQQMLDYTCSIFPQVMAPEGSFIG